MPPINQEILDEYSIEDLLRERDDPSSPLSIVEKMAANGYPEWETDRRLDGKV